MSLLELVVCFVDAKTSLVNSDNVFGALRTTFMIASDTFMVTNVTLSISITLSVFDFAQTNAAL